MLDLLNPHHMITILLDLPQKWRSNPFLENLSHINGFLFISIYDNHILMAGELMV